VRPAQDIDVAFTPGKVVGLREEPPFSVMNICCIDEVSNGFNFRGIDKPLNPVIQDIVSLECRQELPPCSRVACAFSPF